MRLFKSLCCSLSIVLLLLLGSPVPTVLASDSPNKQILLLHSYNIGYKWTDAITASVQKVLSKEQGFDLHIEYLDTKRHSSLKYLDFKLEYLNAKYEQSQFEVILCADNSALSFLLDNRKRLFPKVPIVFCGINSFTPELLQGYDNITGVNEDVNIRKTIELMLSLHPKAERITVINDETDTGSFLKYEILKLSKEFDDIKWLVPHIFTMDQLTTQVSSLGNNDLILLGSFSRDFFGKHIEYDKVATMVSQNPKVPVYSLWDFNLGFGVVGGYMVNGSSQGKQAANIVKMISSGTPADEIPVIYESPNQYLADYMILKHFHIKEGQLPKETIIVNRPPDFYLDHIFEIWLTFLIVLTLTILSCSLTVAVIRKKRAESELLKLTADLEIRVAERTQELSQANDDIQDRESKMQRLLSNLHGMAYRCKNDENWTMYFVSEGVLPLTGYTVQEFIENPTITFNDIVDQRDRSHIFNAVQTAIKSKSHFELEYRIITKDNKLKWVWEQGQAIFGPDDNFLFLDGFVTDISERKTSELEQAKLATAVHQTDDLIIITNPKGIIEYTNPAFSKVSGYSREEMQGKTPNLLKSGKTAMEVYKEMWGTILSGKVWRGRLINKTKTNNEFTAEVTISPIRDQTREITHFVGVQRDISHEIELETNLRHAQKLEAMGTLAGGIAHEINTPAQFISNNLEFVLESMPDLSRFVNQCVEYAKSHHNDNLSDKSPLLELFEESDIAYALDEIPLALQQSQEGIQQVSKIVLSMKQFAHPGQEGKTETDINQSIQNTVTVCSNEWKYVADLEFIPDPELPSVPCHQSEINQVFLNLIVNAAHAIEANQFNDDDKGHISITTSRTKSGVKIRVQDNGCGISDDIKDRLFDPFFTTKEPGKGTGQGLSIAHSIITDKHDGKLYCTSEEGKGSTFIIILPI